MTGLNLYTVTIGIVVLTIASHVHGYFLARPFLNTETNQWKSGDSAVDFHISSHRRDWEGSMDKCQADGGQLASLDNESKKEALILVLEYKNFSDGTRFWVNSCSYGNIYCNGRCTEVTYIKSSGLIVRVFSGADCNAKKRYVCEL